MVDATPGFYLTDLDTVVYLDELGLEYHPNANLDPIKAEEYGIRWVKSNDGVCYYHNPPIRDTKAANPPPVKDKPCCENDTVATVPCENDSGEEEENCCDEEETEDDKDEEDDSDGTDSDDSSLDSDDSDESSLGSIDETNLFAMPPAPAPTPTTVPDAVSEDEPGAEDDAIGDTGEIKSTGITGDPFLDDSNYWPYDSSDDEDEPPPPLPEGWAEEERYGMPFFIHRGLNIGTYFRPTHENDPAVTTFKEQEPKSETQVEAPDTVEPENKTEPEGKAREDESGPDMPAKEVEFKNEAQLEPAKTETVQESDHSDLRAPEPMDNKELLAPDSSVDKGTGDNDEVPPLPGSTFHAQDESSATRKGVHTEESSTKEEAQDSPVSLDEGSSKERVDVATLREQIRLFIAGGGDLNDILPVGIHVHSSSKPVKNQVVGDRMDKNGSGKDQEKETFTSKSQAPSSKTKDKKDMEKEDRKTPQKQPEKKSSRAREERKHRSDKHSSRSKPSQDATKEVPSKEKSSSNDPTRKPPTRSASSDDTKGEHRSRDSTRKPPERSVSSRVTKSERNSKEPSSSSRPHLVKKPSRRHAPSSESPETNPERPHLSRQTSSRHKSSSHASSSSDSTEASSERPRHTTRHSSSRKHKSSSQAPPSESTEPTSERKHLTRQTSSRHKSSSDRHSKKPSTSSGHGTSSRCQNKISSEERTH